MIIDLFQNTAFTLREWEINPIIDSFEIPISLFFLSALIFIISQFLAMHDDIANQDELFDKIFSSCFELKDEKLP